MDLGLNNNYDEVGLCNATLEWGLTLIIATPEIRS